jgi:hypothetical protein
MTHIPLSAAEEQILRRAVEILERESFVARLTELTGEPVSRILKAMPAIASRQIHRAVQTSLKKALEVALKGFDQTEQKEPEPWVYRLASGFAGGASGFIGLPALAVELPITTVMILRAIAGIARKRGEDLNDPAVRMACLEVLALAPRSRKAAAKGLISETSYYAARAFLAKAVSEAASNLIERGVGRATAPVIVDVVATIGSRFGVVVSEKAAAGAIPVVGAIGGAAINLAFMDHFQKLAWAHFSVRKLERSHGAAHIRLKYEQFIVRK